MNQRLFEVCVYGTLKRGYGNHHILEEGKAEFLREDRLKDWVMFDLGGFPFIVPSRWPAADIHVETYAVDKPTLERLDRLEGTPTFYERRIVETIHNRHFIYMYAPVSFARLPTSRLRWVMNGNWTRPIDPNQVIDAKTTKEIHDLVAQSYLDRSLTFGPTYEKPHVKLLNAPKAAAPCLDKVKEVEYRVSYNVEA